MMARGEGGEASEADRGFRRQGLLQVRRNRRRGTGGICLPVRSRNSNAGPRDDSTKPDFVYDADERHLCLSGRRNPHLPLDERGGRQRCCARIGRRSARAARSSTDAPRERNAASVAGSTRSPRACAEAARRRSHARSRCVGKPPSTLRHHQGLDGSDALQDEDDEARRYRDGAARARLQHEAGDGDPRRIETCQGDAGVRRVDRCAKSCAEDVHR